MRLRVGSSINSCSRLVESVVVVVVAVVVVAGERETEREKERKRMPET